MSAADFSIAQEKAVTDVLPMVVDRAMRSYGNYVDRQDVEQELHIWVWEHGVALDRFYGPYGHDFAPMAYTAMMRAANKYCRAERTQQIGPEETWAPQEVKRLLPLYFAKDEPTTTNALVTFADIGGAYEALSVQERELLAAHYGAGWTQKALAAALGVTQSTISERITRAVEALVARLEIKVSEHEGRKAMSNARAQAITRGSYE